MALSRRRIQIQYPVFTWSGLLIASIFAMRFWAIYASGELFHRMAVDWSFFYAQAMALRSGAGPLIYDRGVLTNYLRTISPDPTATSLPVPYPPWFAATVVPFTLPSATVGYALFLGASLVGSVFLAWRVGQSVPRLAWIGAFGAILASMPVTWGLFMGQPVVFLAVAVSEMFISLRSRHDFRAGLWLSVLLLKPQYGILFGLLLVWKRRGKALMGAAVGALAFVIVGVLSAGIAAFVRFPDALAEVSDFRNEIAGPQGMINWRALVLAAAPEIDQHLGVAIVWILAGLTALAALALWRGAWDPASPTFAPRFCALTIATLLTSYHSHLHGAALLIVPFAASWPALAMQPRTRLVLLCALYLPTLFVLWATRGAILDVPSNPDVPLWTVWPGPLPGLLLIVGFCLLWADLHWPAKATRHLPALRTQLYGGQP